jgi:hypothetical protein
MLGIIFGLNAVIFPFLGWFLLFLNEVGFIYLVEVRVLTQL